MTDSARLGAVVLAVWVPLEVRGTMDVRSIEKALRCRSGAREIGQEETR